MTDGLQTKAASSKYRTRAIFACLAVSCGDPSSPTHSPPFIAEYITEALRVVTDFSPELCSGNIALMDAQVSWLQSTYGARDRIPVWIHLYADEQQIAACPIPDDGVALGCWSEPIVYSTWDAVSHELVHEYLDGLNDEVVVFLREGFATALAGGVVWSDENNRLQLVSYLLGEFPISQALYQSGAHFSRWMLDEYGPELSLAFYAKVRNDLPLEEISNLSREVFGVDLDEMLSNYVSEKDYYPSLGPFACGQGEYLEWDGSDILWSDVADCTDGKTIGRYLKDGSFELWRRATVEIPIAGTYDIKGTGGKISMNKCLSAPADQEDLLEPLDGYVHEEWTSFFPLYRPRGTSGIGVQGPVELDAGIYDFWIGQGGEEQVLTFEIRIQHQ